MPIKRSRPGRIHQVRARQVQAARLGKCLQVVVPNKANGVFAVCGLSGLFKGLAMVTALHLGPEW